MSISTRFCCYDKFTMSLATAEDSMEYGGDAIRKLGRLFRATEVFLRDAASRGCLVGDGSKDHAPHRCECPDNSNCLDLCSSNSFAKLSECIGVGDLEFTEEMSAMGLPLSFSTSKKKNARRKKALKVIPLSSCKYPKNSECCTSKFNDASSQTFGGKSSLQPLDIVSESISRLEVEKFVTSANAQHEDDLVNQGDVAKGIFEEPNFDIPLPTDTISDQNSKENTISHNSGVTVDIFSLDREYCSGISVDDACKRSLSDSKLENDTNLETSSEILGFSTDSKIDGIDMETAETSCLDSLESLQNTVRADDCINGSICSDELGSWTVVWDAFYMTNYYYNNVTEESTWHPPPGFEHLANLSNTDEILTDPFNGEFDFGNACDIIEDKAKSQTQEIDSFARSCAQNVDKSLNLSCPEKTFKLHQTATNSISDVTNVSESGEKLVEIICSDIKKLGDDFTVDACHSLDFSDSQEYHESLEDIHGHSSFEKTQCSFSPDFKDHENGGVGQSFNEPKQNMNCLETDESHDVAFSSLCTNISNSTCNESVPKEEMGHFMPQKIATSSTNGTDICFSRGKYEEKLRQIISNQKIFFRKRDCTLPEEMEGFSPDIVKYWFQRYSLFSKFDCGIKMDEEGWFSVTPEPIAKHHASRCGNATVIDCFTCVGGNAIQFAMKNNHVIAIDIDPLKIEYARHNATIYGVQNNIDFIEGDFLHLAAKLKGDVIFMSPPWGGPDYLKARLFDIKTMLKPQNGEFLLRIAKFIAPKVVMFLPRNIDINQLAELALLTDPPWELEVEKNFLNGKLKAITAYFSNTCYTSNDISFKDKYLTTQRP